MPYLDQDYQIGSLGNFSAGTWIPETKWERWQQRSNILGPSVALPWRQRPVDPNDYEIVLPQRGDTITEVVGSKTHVHVVARPDGGEQVWRYCDHQRSRIRLHTKLREIVPRSGEIVD